jgi:hypothetical protein
VHQTPALATNASLTAQNLSTMTASNTDRSGALGARQQKYPPLLASGSAAVARDSVYRHPARMAQQWQ